MNDSGVWDDYDLKEKKMKKGMESMKIVKRNWICEDILDIV